MDEQTRRRRRRAQDGTAANTERQEEDAAQRGVPEETIAAAPSAGERAAVHHRRRRSVSPSQDEGAAGEVFWHPEREQLDEQVNQAAAPKKPSRFQWIKSVDAAVCRLGDDLLAAVKWLGVGALFLLDAILKGFRKAAAHISGLFGAKRTAGRKENEQPDAQVTLQPTRLQDYQGMGSRRTNEGRKRAGGASGKKSSAAYYAVMAALLCVALVSAGMVASILWRSVSTKRLSQSLSQRYSELEQQMTPTPELSPEPTVTPSAMQAQGESAEETPAPSAAPKPADTVRMTKFHQVGGDALPEMEALYQENRDLIGWLRMEGILDLPVVYKDNEYYLTHDFYKNKSASGTLFLDENHPFRENAQNLLLHGHNMKDGTMFGRLIQYETNLQFLKNNPFIQYSTLWKKEQYVIFAVLKVSLDVRSEEFFNYFTHHTFTSDAQFDRYVRSLQNRSVFSIPVSVKSDDALLTLSTCLEDDRLVIVARRVRPGESKSELRHQVQLAARQ